MGDFRAILEDQRPGACLLDAAAMIAVKVRPAAQCQRIRRAATKIQPALRLPLTIKDDIPVRKLAS